MPKPRRCRRSKVTGAAIRPKSSPQVGDKPLQATAGMKGKPSGSVPLAEPKPLPTDARHDGRGRISDTSRRRQVGVRRHCSVIEFAAPGSNDTSSRRCSLSQECVQALGRIIVMSCTPELTVASTVPPSAGTPRGANAGWPGPVLIRREMQSTAVQTYSGSTSVIPGTSPWGRSPVGGLVRSPERRTHTASPIDHLL